MSKESVRWYEYPQAIIVTIALLFIGLALLIPQTLLYILRGLRHPLKNIRESLLSLGVSLAIVLGIGWWLYTDSAALGNTTVSITVKPEMHFGEVTSRLESAQALNHVWLFKAAARLRGIDRTLKVGRYDFSGDVSIRSILNDFATGNVATILITIPEGLRVPETASILASHMGFDSATVVTLCFDSTYCRSEFGLETLEGYLFPETYRFPVGESLQRVLSKLVSDCKAALSHVGTGTTDLTDDEVISLASIIEAEAREGSERTTISSVYHNRLKENMLLQADPTVRFALNQYNRKLYYKDLRVDHPYNTYKYKGLPPGAICSPGIESLRAAVNPADTDFLYFVADGSGKHVFTRTLAEHNRAKERIKREGKAQR